MVSAVRDKMSSKVEASPPPSTIFCRFCNAVISFRAATTEKFKMHMETVHEIYLDLDFLLSIHFIKEEEKTSMVRQQCVKPKIVLLSNLFVSI